MPTRMDTFVCFINLQGLCLIYANNCIDFCLFNEMQLFFYLDFLICAYNPLSTV